MMVVKEQDSHKWEACPLWNNESTNHLKFNFNFYCIILRKRKWLQCWLQNECIKSSAFTYICGQIYKYRAFFLYLIMNFHYIKSVNQKKIILDCNLNEYVYRIFPWSILGSSLSTSLCPEEGSWAVNGPVIFGKCMCSVLIVALSIDFQLSGINSRNEKIVSLIMIYWCGSFNPATYHAVSAMQYN